MAASTTRTRRDDIRQAYTDLGYKRAKFAQLVDVPPRTITNIVCGGTFSEAVAVRIASVLGWTPEQVLEGPKPTGPGRPAKDGRQPANPTGPHTPKSPRRVRSAA